MNFSQPSNDLDATIPAQRQAPAEGSYNLTASYLATYALTVRESDREAIRNSLPEEQRAAFDMCMAVQADRGDVEASTRDSRMLADELERLEVKDRAKEAYRLKRVAALADGADDAAEAFAAKVMGSASLGEIEVLPPLVDNFLDRNSMARVYGPSGQKKSFAILDMAACVAAGIEWHGNATHQAKTLYIVAEGATGILKRVRAWEQEYGQTMQVDFFPEAVQIGDEEQMRQLIAFARRGYEFIIFDTQARCVVGIDENDNTRMGEIVAALDVLKRETKACVLLVHHSGNDASKGRGATAVLGAMDAEFAVTCKSHGVFVDFDTKKRKDGREADTLKLEVEERFVQTPRGTETSLTVKRGTSRAGAAAQAVPKLSDLQSETLVALAKYDSIPPSGLLADLGIEYKNRNQVNAHLKSLLDKDCVEKVGAGHWRITSTGRAVLNVKGLWSQGHVEAIDEGEED